MATGADRRKVLSVAGQDKVTRQMLAKKKEKKRRASGIWSLKFYDPDDFEKAKPKLLVRLNGTDRKESGFESQNEGTL
jgi:hypothetical protein